MHIHILVPKSYFSATLFSALNFRTQGSNGGNLNVLNSYFSATPFRIFFNSHALRAQGINDNLWFLCSRPEVTQLVEVCQLDPGLVIRITVLNFSLLHSQIKKLQSQP